MSIQDERQMVYAHHFQIIESNYYNFVLFCHNLNLPRPFLYLLTRRLIFKLLSWGLLDRACGWLLSQLLALRLRMNQRLYARRRAEWLKQSCPNPHA
jgi:hypothetical protein